MAPADCSVSRQIQDSEGCGEVPLIAVVDTCEEEPPKETPERSPSQEEAELAKALIVDDAEFLARLATFLERAVERNELAAEKESGVEVGFKHMLPTGRLTAFHGVRAPPIALLPYLKRISKFGKCSPVCLLMALVYMERLEQSDSGMRIACLSVHRLLITGVVLSCKLTDDRYFNNAHYAKVGGVSTKELNLMELEMFKRLSFRTYVSPTEILKTLKTLERFSKKSADLAEPRHGKKRLSEGVGDLLFAPPQKQDVRRHSVEGGPVAAPLAVAA